MNNNAGPSGLFFFFLQYPYLGLCLILFILSVCSWIILPNQRRPLVLSGLLSLPYGVASVFFVPEYWMPVRLINGLIGIEDLLFSLANGFLTWAIVTFNPSKGWILNIQPFFLSARYLICTFSGGVVSLVLWFLGFRVMTAFLLGMVGLFFFILRMKKGLLWTAFSGALGFGLLYGLILKGIFLVNPDFIHQWNLSNLSGLFIGGIPIEEVCWALGFGGVWPLFMTYVFDGRQVDKKA